MEIQTFKHVDYLWDEAKASQLEGDEVALLLYRSNILGTDLRITNYGGGNTSCRTLEADPLTGEKKEIMWIKGSGGNLGSLKRDGIAGLYVERLHALKNIYRGLKFEDEMVQLYQHCIFDLDSRAPSIDTALHGLLPFKHIDHLHPDALIAIAACKDGKQIAKEIWGEKMGWVPWQRPGFDLGIQIENCQKDNPGIRGIILGGHGLFTWGDTSYDSYINSLEVIEQASAFIEEKLGKERSVFGGFILESPEESARKDQAAKIAPVLRGLTSEQNRMIGHFRDDQVVLDFINSKDLQTLAPLGTSCPDHFLRTKIKPLVLDLSPDADLSDPITVKNQLTPSFIQYRKDYSTYYENHKHDDSPAIRDANPVVILYPGIGMFTYAKNKQTARVASEFYINAINVMRGAEAISQYVALDHQEAFNIEYWLLEEAKLQRMPPEMPLSRHIAVVTGAAGGIGKAITDTLTKQGAVVVLTDISEKRLQEANATYQPDVSTCVVCNVSNESTVNDAYKVACLEFGGVDIVVHSAGLAISKPLEDHTLDDWNTLQDVMVKGQFLMAQKGAAVMRTQGIGGNIINIASKNGLVAGPNNVAYGTAKAAQQHMTRLLAAELAADNIRVNTVNPDGVIVGSKIWEGKWAEERARVNNITVEELPDFYAKRNLLHKIILPQDIANGVFATLAILDKTTGNMLNVDGGMAAAFPR